MIDLLIYSLGNLIHMYSLSLPDNNITVDFGMVSFILTRVADDVSGLLVQDCRI